MTTPEASPESGLGGRLAAKIAETVVRASLSAKAQAGPHQVSIAQTVLTNFTNHVSDEIKSTMGPLWTRLAEDPATPEAFRPTLQALAHETGQAWGLISGLVSSSALSTGLLDGLTNEFAPLVQSWIASDPNSLLSPQTAAQAQARHLNAILDGEAEARAGGLTGLRYNILVELARNRLTPQDVLEGLRRGTVSRKDAEKHLALNGYTPMDVETLLKFQQVHLSPPDAAAAWARSELSETQVDAIGAFSGVSKEDMRIFRALAGQPPSPEELLFAWRRGIIKEADVDRGLVQGPIRNEWLPVIKALQWIPLPIGEAANAVNQGHLPMAKAVQAAKENGMKEDAFKIVVDNAGRPPGPQEALDWINRGYITEQQFREIFLESTLKNKYIDLYLRSRFEVMPPETIRLMVSRGALTKEEGLKRLQQRGYTPDDAAIIIDGASAEKTTQGRDLTVSQVLDLRAEGLITDDDALAMLEAAGYDTDEALWITQLADLKRVSAFVRAAINRTKASYLAGRIDEVRAGGILDSLGLPADFKDNTFALWDLERTTVTKGLTTAQIVSAIKKGFMSIEDGMARLVGQGYAEDDAQILLLIGGAAEG